MIARRSWWRQTLHHGTLLVTFALLVALAFGGWLMLSEQWTPPLLHFGSPKPAASAKPTAKPTTTLGATPAHPSTTKPTSTSSK